MVFRDKIFHAFDAESTVPPKWRGWSLQHFHINFKIRINVHNTAYTAYTLYNTHARRHIVQAALHMLPIHAHSTSMTMAHTCTAAVRVYWIVRWSHTATRSRTTDLTIAHMWLVFRQRCTHTHMSVHRANDVYVYVWSSSYIEKYDVSFIKLADWSRWYPTIVYIGATPDHSGFECQSTCIFAFV